MVRASIRIGIGRPSGSMGNTILLDSKFSFSNAPRPWARGFGLKGADVNDNLGSGGSGAPRRGIVGAILAGLVLMAAACSTEGVVSESSGTLVAGRVTDSSGQAVPGASLSVRYEFSDTTSADSASMNASVSGINDKLEFFSAVQRGLELELSWSVDSVAFIDTFMVKRRDPGAEAFVRVAAIPSDSSELDYAWSDSVVLEPGRFVYRLFPEIPGGGLAGDSLQTEVSFLNQLGRPRPNPMVGELNITTSFVAPSAYEARITKFSGDIIRLLDMGEAEGGSQVEISWDGRDESGALVPGGFYNFRLLAGAEVPDLLVTQVFVNEGLDAVSDSTGNYELLELSTARLVRRIDASGAVLGVSEVLQSMEITASAVGYVEQTRELILVPAFENRLDFTLEPQ